LYSKEKNSMDSSEEEATKLSKINSASLINLRIHNLWLNVNRFASSGKYFQWNTELDRIYCELSGDIQEGSKKKKDEDKKSIPDEFKDLNEKVSEKLKELKPLKGFDKHSEDQKTNMKKTYEVILNKEIFLRKLMNKQGKGTAYEDSWDEYIKG